MPGAVSKDTPDSEPTEGPAGPATGADGAEVAAPTGRRERRASRQSGKMSPAATHAKVSPESPALMPFFLMASFSHMAACSADPQP
eukprot:7266640-Alexandrium_andersonii.AAC.1